ncbi:hypothetical protein [Methylobacterium sp. JK268]
MLADVVDHKHPVSDGGAVHCPDAGLWSLCTPCHAWKRWLENYARQTGQMDRIVAWCDDPAVRPRERGEVRHGGGAP